MSIFDRDSPHDPSDWLKEKTLRALQDAARFIDLANEPDTTAWYAKRLREIAEPLVAHLLPVVALLYGAAGPAVTLAAWRPILTGGTFALAKWAKTFKVVDPVEGQFAPFAPEASDDEVEEKAHPLPQGLKGVDEAGALELRVEVYAFMVRKIAEGEYSAAELRLLAWLLRDLRYSDVADCVHVSRRFLPTDIGSTIDETAAAYRSLYERGFIERVDGMPGVSGQGDQLGIRIVAESVNASRHPLPYQEETFGFPGARVGGKPTIGNELTLELPDTLGKVVERWQLGEEDLVELRLHLQEKVDEDQAFIESVSVDRRGFVVRARYPMEASDVLIQQVLSTATAAWLRARTVSRT